ncbi:hypothetical protein U9M73_16985 [Paenibacillus phoenicis]|uniref:Uncharacterized protein n=1 Tax=Paenibacillus phoenicis TaxID=554117 RepID=A0ABU5PPA5_9BACL|nr:hypothetical protein [Paenibacillus phoenicis]MEA3571647.1 hypothetical protein [Paenibacillus phoenicis]
MEYLNISLEPMDNENSIIYCGDTIIVDCSLLHNASHNCCTIMFRKTSEAMEQLVNQSTSETHINLFVEQIDPATYGAIHGFLKSALDKKENHPPSVIRLMVWVFDQKTQDFIAYDFYEV